MPTRVSEPSLRERVGGRYAISWWSFACLAVLGAGATALHGPDSLQVWALLALVSTAALGAVFLVAGLTVLRRRAEAPVAPWVVVTVALTAGAVRAAALLATADGSLTIWGASLYTDSIQFVSRAGQVETHTELAGVRKGSRVIGLRSGRTSQERSFWGMSTKPR